MKLVVNERNSSIKRCAFCKNWYDPTNSAINPKAGRYMWEYESSAKNKCREKNLITNAGQGCAKFELKL